MYWGTAVKSVIIRWYVHVCRAQSCLILCDAPWSVAHQDPLSMEFSSQEYWSGLSLPPPGHLPDPGIKPMSSALAGRFFTTEPAGKPDYKILACIQRTLPS